MATTTMQLYWDLASIDPTVRQNASQTLIRVLADFQKDHESSLESRSNDLADTEEELDALCAADVSYAIRRLIRGLPSSRQGARQGFSLALTEVNRHLSPNNKLTHHPCSLVTCCYQCHQSEACSRFALQVH